MFHSFFVCLPEGNQTSGPSEWQSSSLSSRVLDPKLGTCADDFMSVMKVFSGMKHLPSGKHTKNYGKSPI
jgi:hypothetical protein